jgi:hypothetical protein
MFGIGATGFSVGALVGLVVRAIVVATVVGEDVVASAQQKLSKQIKRKRKRRKEKFINISIKSYGFWIGCKLLLIQQMRVTLFYISKELYVLLRSS